MCIKLCRPFEYSHPQVSIEGAVLHGFGQMLRREFIIAGKVGDRTRDFEDPNNTSLVES